MAKRVDEEDKLTRVCRIMEDTLQSFDSRLSGVERALEEMRQGQNVVLEERHVPETRGLLGGRTLLTSPLGGMERIIHPPVCDSCGSNLPDGKYALCQNCGRKCCLERCAVMHENRYLCHECLRIFLPSIQEGVQGACDHSEQGYRCQNHL